MATNLSEALNELAMLFRQASVNCKSVSWHTLHQIQCILIKLSYFSRWKIIHIAPVCCKLCCLAHLMKELGFLLHFCFRFCFLVMLYYQWCCMFVPLHSLISVSTISSRTAWSWKTDLTPCRLPCSWALRSAHTDLTRPVWHLRQQPGSVLFRRTRHDRWLL